MTHALMARFQDEPSLVAPEKAAWFEACLTQANTEMGRILSLAQAANENMAVEDAQWWGEPGSWTAYLRPYVVRDGVLQIPVKGVLLNDFPYALGSWATGYDYIWRAFQRGMTDGNVRGIALIVDSPGGMVDGCFECADKMVAMRGQKPVAGFASSSAYSAAYALISIVDPGQLYVTRTGGVGSIGVVTSHVSIAGAMEKSGAVMTFIFAGKHKVDGNRYEALPDDVKARIQARIDDVYSIFVSTVARNRDLDEQAVRKTEALTFGAPDALSNGLADKIGALDDSLADFSASLTINEEDDQMAEISQAEHEAAVATARTEATAAGVTTGRAEGVTSERTRIAAIMGSEEAKTRPAAARMLAFDTDKDAESAVAALGKLPAEASANTTVAEPTAGAPAGLFEAAMDGSPNPGIRATEGEASTDDDPINLARSFGLAGVAAATAK